MEVMLIKVGWASLSFRCHVLCPLFESLLSDMEKGGERTLTAVAAQESLT